MAKRASVLSEGKSNETPRKPITVVSIYSILAELCYSMILVIKSAKHERSDNNEACFFFRISVVIGAKRESVR